MASTASPPNPTTPPARSRSGRAETPEEFDMTRLYEVRCTATAEVYELWHVRAASPAEAIAAIEDRHDGSPDIEFVRTFAAYNERNRADFEATEAGEPAPGAVPAALADAAPELLAFIAQIARMISTDEADGFDLDNDAAMDGLIARARNLQAKAEGRAA